MRGVLFAALVAGAGCVGAIGDRDATPPATVPPATSGTLPPPSTCRSSPGPAPLRRLTRVEYNNTVRELLGDGTQPANAFVAEDRELGFTNNAAALGVTEVLEEQMVLAAEALAARADPVRLLPCAPARIGDDACARLFIESFGRRAFRRPLDATELGRFAQLHAAGRQGADFARGVRWVIEAMLLSPHFLYRVELGAALTGWEMASRLSYLFWGSMPDEALLVAAAAEQLTTPGQVAVQARRLLADARARPVVARFHAEWLGLDLVDQIEKDRAVYKTFTTSLRPLMRTETERFLDFVVWDGPGDLATLLAGRFSFLNATLASFYGVGGPAGSTFQRTSVDATRRAGFLTHAGLLGVNAKPNQTSPVQRGKFVQEQLICTDLPPPPGNVEAILPEPSATATTRERFSQHSAVPACAGCHQLMDPIGLGFEHYDGVGRWRDTENGRAVDASGVIKGSDVDGPFVGAVALADRLAGSAAVRGCVVRQWFRFAHGRAETAEDACTLAKVGERFAAAKYDVRELLVALTQTDAFLYRGAR